MNPYDGLIMTSPYFELLGVLMIFCSGVVLGTRIGRWLEQRLLPEADQYRLDALDQVPHGDVPLVPKLKTGEFRSLCDPRGRRAGP